MTTPIKMDEERNTTFDPDFEYEVANGTFAEGELLLPGKSVVFG